MSLRICIRALLTRFMHTVYEPLADRLPGVGDVPVHGIPTSGLDDHQSARFAEAMDLLRRRYPQSYRVACIS